MVNQRCDEHRCVDPSLKKIVILSVAKDLNVNFKHSYTVGYQSS